MKRESQRRYSLDEYFAVEETSQVKNEYYDGQIFAMAGASLEHNDIAANLLSFLRPALLPRGCRAFGSHLRVQTPGGLFTYPDLSAVCGEPLLIQGRPDTLTNPLLLIEVLSDATREYDRGQKFSLSKEIPALREYVIIESPGRNVLYIGCWLASEDLRQSRYCGHFGIGERHDAITGNLSDGFRVAH